MLGRVVGGRGRCDDEVEHRNGEVGGRRRSRDHVVVGRRLVDLQLIDIGDVNTALKMVIYKIRFDIENLKNV
jgi:hypothetical protein